MENMENHTSSSIIIGTEDWTPIGDLSNDNISIFIQKNLNIRPIDARDNQDGVNEQGGEVITKKDETNPNGIEVFKSISTIPDPDSNKNLKYYEMYFNDENGATYCISIYGYDSEDAKLIETTDMVFNSLKMG